MLLAELGAEVIKIEVPGSGDATRTLAPQTVAEESYLYIAMNRGKKSITLDIREQEGQQVFKDLVKKCDVFVENFSPRVMDQLSLTYSDLSVLNPSLIYTSISGFGHTGPYKNLVAFDIIVQAMGGLVAVNGHPDGQPTKVAIAIADFLAGQNAALAISAALNYRSKTNQGQYIDISMQDCIWGITSLQFLPGYIVSGEEPEKVGNRTVEVTPFNVYKAKDGRVVIGVVTVAQWQRLLDIMGREDLKNVPEYASQKDRIRYVDTIDAIVEAWTMQHTVDHIVQTLHDADLPCADIPSFGAVANDPQLANRNMIVDVDQLISGPVKVPGTVFKMSETPGDATQPASFLGQYNFDIYSDLLGYDDNKIAQLQDKGII
jgi:crotonobetainyl-CoA:carnitine CoA-transferase CaiB-like acyl-CoA transferase